MHGNPLGPLRVWHLKEDIPGLAMTRSFGDQAAAQVGVIAAPEILEMNLQYKSICFADINSLLYDL